MPDIPDRAAVDLVDAYRRITQDTRTQGRRHLEVHAAAMLTELRGRGLEQLADDLAGERTLVWENTVGSDRLAAGDVRLALARLQRCIRVARAALAAQPALAVTQ